MCRHMPPPTVARALDERRRAGSTGIKPTVVEAPDRSSPERSPPSSGESRAVRLCPATAPYVTSISGVRGRPTLVNNVETLAHIALIARFGPHWFRSVGDPDEPGTMLVTLSGALTKRGVFEVPTGALVSDLVARCGATDPNTRARGTARRLSRQLDPRASASDSTRGCPSEQRCGIVHALGRHECGLARTAAIADYLADQSARQCGPCRTGLPRLAHSARPPRL